MQLSIRHETVYRYDRPIDYAVQLVRLTPLNHAGQRVLNWRVADGNGRLLPSTTDGYGNVVHMMSVHRRHSDARIVAEGLVETAETHGMLREADERLPRLYYTRTTPLTQPDAAIRALADEVRGSIDAIEQLHRLMLKVHKRVAYVVGATSVTTTGAEALARGSGVCQDHAHIFLACTRLLGHAARYVSGYLWEGDKTEPIEAGHAWAEAYVDNVGWVGFDPANGIAPAENYVRTAIGLDYREAAPVRGVWRGAAAETLAVNLKVQQVQSQQ
jgi:transglutaminase-like putative cysteine protease